MWSELIPTKSGLYWVKGNIMGHEDARVVMVSFENHARWLVSVYPLPDGGHIIYQQDLKDCQWHEVLPPEE